MQPIQGFKLTGHWGSEVLFQAMRYARAAHQDKPIMENTHRLFVCTLYQAICFGPRLPHAAPLFIIVAYDERLLRVVRLNSSSLAHVFYLFGDKPSGFVAV